jgi:hypothetical protein
VAAKTSASHGASSDVDVLELDTKPLAEKRKPPPGERFSFQADTTGSSEDATFPSEDDTAPLTTQLLPPRATSTLRRARSIMSFDAAWMSKGLYLWGMLQAWKVQQRYLANDFKNDPALTGIMVRRLLLHGGDTTVKDKLIKLDSLLAKVDDHHRLHAAQMRNLQDSLRMKADK